VDVLFWGVIEAAAAAAAAAADLAAAEVIANVVLQYWGHCQDADVGHSQAHGAR